jgi:membrane associated rhomboid family serine protease
MEPTLAVIPAQSERQAMDWSLVLVSQGIETVIGRDPETGRWQLAVPDFDRRRALEAIRLYRLENRRRAWHQAVPWTGLIFDWRSTVWFIGLAVLFAWCEGRFPHLRSVGEMNSQLVAQGQWWRLFTAVTLHADLPHLASNTVTGVLLLGLAMGSFGPGLAPLAAFLAGAGGNLVALIFYPGTHRGLGASGMVMGALGLLTVQSLALVRQGANARQLLVRGLSGGVLLLVLLGANPNSDVLTHVAGFAWGCLLGGMLGLWPTRWTFNPWINRLAFVGCVGLALLTWALALR